MDRLTVAFLVILCVLSGFTTVAWGSSDQGFPIIQRISQSILFAFLPPLVGSLVGVFVANRLEHRRARAERQKEQREKEDEKRRDRDVLLTNIRGELGQSMILIMSLLDPVKLHFIRSGEWPLSERFHTETWDSCIYSGQTALLGFKERCKIALVYQLIGDYNKRDWEKEDNLRRERTVVNIREQISRLVQEESFWPRSVPEQGK